MRQTRQEKSLQDKIEKLRAELSSTGEVLKGNLIRLKSKPGQDRKSAHQITWKGAGNKTRTLYVPEERLAETKAMLSAYKKVRAAVEQMAELTADLYKIHAE